MNGVSIIGAGYVGLVTGACLASRGIRVVCVDMDQDRVDTIMSGRAPIHEVGLDELLQQTVGSTLTATTDLAAAVRDTDVTLVAVGTPSTPEGIDLTYVRGAAAQIGEVLRGKDDFHVVAVKSTVVPGSTDTAVLEELERASGKKAGVDFGVGVNPEFLTEGTAVEDFMEPDRIVIGAEDERTAKRLAELYAGFPDTELIVTNSRTAEMIKYASNALLATMISFSNELANLGSALGGIDMVDVMRGVHASRYITTRRPDGDVVAPLASFLYAGTGFGGSCLPKDVTALAAHGRGAGLDMRLLESVLAVNAGQPDVMVRLIEQRAGNLSGLTVGILGLAFKPDTNDTRESPAFPVIRRLVERGATVVAHDPVVEPRDMPPDVVPLVDLVDDLGEVLAASDVVALVTSWSEYRTLPELLGAMDDPPPLVDGRRMISPSSVPDYSGIGFGG